jgi:hypothetical protein
MIFGESKFKLDILIVFYIFCHFFVYNIVFFSLLSYNITLTAGYWEQRGDG